MASRNILDSGDWLNLTVNGRPYLKKPPLLMWLQASIGSLTGEIGELEARIPGALAGVGVVGLTGLLGMILLGRTAGFWGALFLAVTPFFLKEGRLARMDMLVALATTASFLGFALYERRVGPRWAAILLFLLPLPVGVLAKWAGPIFVLPPVIVYLIVFRKRRRFPIWPVVLGVGLAIVPFLVFSDLREFGRITTGKAHYKPFYFQLLRFPAITAPFILVAPWAIRRVLKKGMSVGEKRGLMLFAIWVAWGLLILTINGSKRSNYMDPLLPPTMLMLGWYAALTIEAGRIPGLGRLPPRRTYEAIAGLSAILCFAVFVFHLPTLNRENSPREFTDLIRSRAAGDAVFGYAGRPKRGGRWPGPDLLYYLEKNIEPIVGEEEFTEWFSLPGERWAISRPERYDLLLDYGGGRLPEGVRIEARRVWKSDPYVLLSNRRGEGEEVVIGPEERGAGSASE